MKGRWLISAAAVLAVAGALGGAAAIRASEPAEQSASVPLPADDHGLVDGDDPRGVARDERLLDARRRADGPPSCDSTAVPKKGYTGIMMTSPFEIPWTPASGVEQANDEISPSSSKEFDQGGSSGTHVVGSSDSSLDDRDGRRDQPLTR